MSSDNRPIGVFDSGLGGLTVVKDLAKILPGEDIVYLGDSARVPYGIKSLATIRRFAMEDAAFLGRFDPKLLVVACNTASAAAIDAITATAPCDVVDVVRPSAAAALAATDGPVGVVATEATVRSGAYQRALAADGAGREILAVACPLLVPIVEEGRDGDDPIVTHVLCDYLRNLQRLRPGAMVLGCTHYPLLAGPIGKLMGPATQLISSATAAALDVAHRLDAAGMRHARVEGGSLRCHTTDNPQRFAELGATFGGRPLDHVEYVGTDELEGLVARRPVKS
ncbi:MAG: glutamate racemase [Planctomycetes bacterium]|jgi:glutamate racemase|nr:glutamate racemase [Phycisphaerae bacterium]NBB94111.1 glutamate racemase [Planctomycetota bacterium]